MIIKIGRKFQCNEKYFQCFFAVYSKPQTGADSFTDILDLHPYLDNRVVNCHQMWHGDSLYPYLGPYRSRNYKYKAICLFLSFFVNFSLLIFPLIISQYLLNFHQTVHQKGFNGGNIFSSWKVLITEIQKSPARCIGLQQSTPW